MGIGGSGMCGIAEVLHAAGYQVTGSDIQESVRTRFMQSLGMKISFGHRAENLGDAEMVVRSSAVDDSNSEILEAQASGRSVIRRSQCLGILMKSRFGIAVTGTHGKTTVTHMLSRLMDEAWLDPTVVLGAPLEGETIYGRLGRGKHMVAEACEAFGSMMDLDPTIAVVTNVENDHMDFYGDMDSLRKAIKDFIEKIPRHGVAVLCADDPWLRQIAVELKVPVQTYGLRDDAEIHATDIMGSERGTSFTAWAGSEKLGRVRLQVAGRHNVQNALAVLSVARRLDILWPRIADSLSRFGGTARRFEFRGEYQKITIFDDYAHHPTEIRANLETAREMVKGRLWAVFQPHLYSRTKDLAKEFALALDIADEVLLLPIFPAREAPLEGVTSELISKKAKDAGLQDTKFRSVMNHQLAANKIADLAGAGDLVLTMGAGDVWKVSRLLEARLGSGMTKQALIKAGNGG